MKQDANEARAFLKANPDIEYFDAFIIDLCGRAVGKRYPVSQLEKVYASGTQLCAATYLLDVNGNTSDPLGYGFSDGDPDADAWPVPGTLKPCPWSNGKGAQCMIVLKDPGTNTPVWFEPRTILQNITKRLAKMKLTPVVAVELEFYLTDSRRSEEGAPQPPVNPRSGARSWSGEVFGLGILEDFSEVLTTISKICEVQGIPASTALSEYGAGQFEINLDHTSDPVKAADDAALLRRAVVTGARQAGFDATFLSKPYGDLSGSGMHVHLSLLNEKDQNIFDPSRDKKGEKLKNVVAGFQALLPDSMAIFAPNFNAFRRFEPDQFVPVTPDWGENNRSMAFRIPASDPANTRIEHRVSGADANPYLVVASILAAAHFGLSNALKPSPMASGNAGANVDENLPLKLWSALDRLEGSKVLKDYLGKDFPAAYVAVKRGELDDFLSEISAREHEWYL